MSKQNDLFKQINNAVLDLQRSEYNTYKHNINKLCRLLMHDELLSARNELTLGLNLHEFLGSQQLNRGMGGSAIQWPDDPKNP